MRRVSFDEVGAVVATFLRGEDVEVGQAVMMDGDDRVNLCAAGKRPCGTAISVASDGCAGVLVRGAAAVSYSGAELTAGWQRVTGNGTGGVKLAGTGDEGMDVLVLRADTAEKTAVVLL